jgi:hypothetical protein
MIIPPEKEYITFGRCYKAVKKYFNAGVPVDSDPAAGFI